jgi:hypothetical protein
MGFRRSAAEAHSRHATFVVAPRRCMNFGHAHMRLMALILYLSRVLRRANRNSCDLWRGGVICHPDACSFLGFAGVV